MKLKEKIKGWFVSRHHLSIVMHDYTSQQTSEIYSHVDELVANAVQTLMDENRKLANKTTALLHETENHLVRAMDSRFESYCSKPPVVLSSWVEHEDYILSHRNLGDELSYYIVRRLSDNPVIFSEQVNTSDVELELMCVGSIVQLMNKKTVIWGAGLITDNLTLDVVPFDVRAVRGPLTRKKLIDSNIPCPAVYGDPVLLLKRLYTPKQVKKFKLGIILHYVDYDLPHVREFREVNNNILFVNMQGYDTWQEVVEKIASCEYIISSSLHGLIIADCYNIPNALAFFSNKIVGGEFKYLDYFKGVKRKYYAPLDYTNHINLNDANQILSEYSGITFNPDDLLAVCPFPLKK